MIINNLETCQKKYDLIYTDPAWQQKKGNLRKCRPNQGKELDYSTCTLDEIKAIHAKAMKLCNSEHNIFMWTIDKYLHDAENMMQSLGYMLHARLIWDKGNGIAPAFTVRFSHEYLLWFYQKGHMMKPCVETRGKFTTVFREKSTIHSRKPEFAYEMLEAMFPNAAKLELFARNARDKWDCWGKEVNEE